jgi:Flp pilus assembly protein TadG
MIALRSLVSRLRAEKDGAVLIETAFVAPVLILMSLGAFQVSTLVARNSELVGAVAEAQSMILATDLDSQQQRDQLKDLLADSTRLPADNITVEQAFRCNQDMSYANTFAACESGDRVSTFIKIEVSDTYTPVWTKLGIADPIEFRVDRYIMYKQATKP